MNDMSLFTELSVGSCRLKNRVVFASTSNNLGTHLDVTPEQLAFYEERARGGVAAIVTEGLSVHETSVPFSTVPFAFDQRAIPGLERLAEAVHAHDTLLFGQLWHVGRNSLWNPFLLPWSASGERDPFSGTTPHAMTEDEIWEVIEGYVASAQNLRTAGFDGVEVHGAHGYLLTQFMSPWSNKRTDGWGGTMEGRVRLVEEIIRGIRRRCGGDFVVGLKLSAHEYVTGGLDLEATQEIVAHLAASASPDFFAVSQSNFSPSLERHVPDMRWPDMPFRHLAQGVRDVAAGVPVMSLAKIPDDQAAAELISSGAADFVGMTRPLLADPHAVEKWRTGAKARPCIYCNVCWEGIHSLRKISCIYAPETGQEQRGLSVLDPMPDPDRRTVRVVGGGPAGLEVARVAASVGHEVHLYERSSVFGGRMAREAAVPGRESMQDAIDWLVESAIDAGAVLNASHDVSEEVMASWDRTDVVVQATGAVPVVTPVPGAGVEMRSLEEAIQDPRSLAAPIVFVDEIEDEPVYAAVEFAASIHEGVQVLTNRAVIGRRVAAVSMIGVNRRLDEHGVKIHPMVVPVRVEDGELIVRHVLSGIERTLGGVRTIVCAGPYVASDRLAGHGGMTLVAGDAYAPRSVLAVVQDAHEIARSINADT